MDLEFWKTLQKDQAAWCDYNFGKRKPHQPFLGLVEEFGELLEAKAKNDRAAIDDAIADIAIFGADLATSYGHDLGEIVTEAHAKLKERSDPDDFTWDQISIANGRIGHHILKLEQGIRGTPEEHLRGIRDNLANVFFVLFAVCIAGWTKTNLESLTAEVWMKVRQRDWKKDSAHAGVGA